MARGRAAGGLALLQLACGPGPVRGLGPWQQGLQGSHYWDCNGQGCDATLLKPWDKHRFISAPQYAPADPNDFGGPVYGERLWLTGAASDALSQQLGRDSGCCGADRASGGCGRCLLVRNPTSDHPDWTAVVMKKSRCPPNSKGCELPKVHLDIAAPGYDNITVSTANICGEPNYDTYITKIESSVCAGTHGGCSCEGMPNNTDATRMLKRGCVLFGSWGWMQGAPVLEWQPVDCPAKFEERLKSAFGSTGVNPVKRPRLWPWIAAGVAVVLLCVGACLVNRILDDRREKKEKARMQLKREKREKERLRGRNFGGRSQALSDGSSSGASSSSSDSEGC